MQGVTLIGRQRPGPGVVLALGGSRRVVTDEGGRGQDTAPTLRTVDGVPPGDTRVPLEKARWGRADHACQFPGVATVNSLSLYNSCEAQLEWQRNRKDRGSGCASLMAVVLQEDWQALSGRHSSVASPTIRLMATSSAT